MGYVNTPAHTTASDALRAGDPVWPGNGRLVIRRANVEPVPQYPVLNQRGGADLGWVESIGPLIQALTTAGTATYGVIEARKQSKEAQAQEKKARAQAAAEAKQAAEMAAAAQAQIKAAEVKQAESRSNLTPVIIGAAGLGAVALIMFMLKR